MAQVAIEIMGEPNRALSRGDELRWGERGSFCVNKRKGTWVDHENGSRGGGVLDFLRERRNLEKPEAIGFLRERHFLTDATIAPKVVATYDYTDQDGVLLFQVVRFEPKDFRQRKPDGRGGWIWKMTGVRKVIYQLPRVLDAVARGDTIYICEGEKACHAMARHGFVATCSPGGAQKWNQPSYADALQGARVVILADLDEPGEKHARQVEKALLGKVQHVRIVVGLPDTFPKGDAHDFFANGGTASSLIEYLGNTLREERPDCGNAKTSSKTKNDISGFDLTEDGIAQAFTKRHADDLRYCHDTGAWFQWTDQRWRKDETKTAFNWARLMCRQMAAQAPEGKRHTYLKATTASAVERLAQADPALAVQSSI